MVTLGNLQELLQWLIRHAHGSQNKGVLQVEMWTILVKYLRKNKDKQVWIEKNIYGSIMSPYVSRNSTFLYP